MDVHKFPTRTSIRLGNILILSVIAAVAGSSGWSFLSNIEGPELIRETRDLPIPVFTGAVHFALGRGIGVVHDKEEGFEELEAFVHSRINVIPRHTYPEPGRYPKITGHFFYMHYYLIAYLGMIFRLFGISTWSFRLACVLLHIVSMLLIYGIFRLAMGRLMSAVLVCLLAVSQPYMHMLPILRDFGKVPFILASIGILGILVKHGVKRRSLLLWSFLLGVIISIGYGFRQDVFVCLPLGLFCIVLANLKDDAKPRRTKFMACIVCLTAYAILAVPVFQGDREVGGTITVHTLFQGLTASAENNADFGSVSYDFGFLNFDHPIIATIRGYAKRTGDIYPVQDLTPEYGAVGRRMFLDVLLNYPADLAGRGLAVMDALFGIPDTAFIREKYVADEESNGKGSNYAKVQVCFDHVARFLRAYGMLIALITLALVAGARLKWALYITLFWGYFSAYPSTLFEFRHYFYLAFVPFFFAGLLITITVRFFLSSLRHYRTGTLGNAFFVYARCISKGTLFVVLVIAITMSILGVLRVYQRQRWNTYLDRLEQARLTPVPFVKEAHKGKIRFLLTESVAAMQGTASVPEHEVASAFLAVRFNGGNRTLSFDLLNTNPLLSRPCTVVLQGEGHYFFPVYDFSFEPPFSFLGIEVNGADSLFLEGIYLVENADALRLWPYVFLPEKRKYFNYAKMGRLDRAFQHLRVEVASGFGRWPERALLEYEQLIRKYPLHAHFADYALRRAEDHGDRAQLIQLWEVIGAFVPERRLEACLWLARQAESALSENLFDDAISLYQKAAQLMPDDLTYRIRIAEIYEQSEGVSSALQEYEDILENNPALFPIAYKIYELSLQLDSQDDVLAYWRELTGRHPGEVIPWLFYGIQNEAQGDLHTASKAYEKVLDINPEDPEALFRQGALHLRHDNFDTGKGMLLHAASIAPSMKERVINLFYEEAFRLFSEKDFSGAARRYESILEQVPEDVSAKMHLAEICSLYGSESRAENLYKEVLRHQPDNYAAANSLDALLFHKSEGTQEDVQDQKILEQVLSFWRSLSETYPDEPLPVVYTGVTSERFNDNEGARQAYKRALEIQPNLTIALYRLGGLEILDGQTEAGISRIKNASALEPAMAGEISEHCSYLAKRLLTEGKTDDAVLLYSLALEISPHDLWPLVHLSDLYEDMGDHESAIASYSKVLLSAPESPRSAARLDAILSAVYPDSDDPIQQWYKILEQHPQSRIPRIYLGANLRRKGDYKGAREAFLKALNIDPDLGEAIHRLDGLDISEGNFDSDYSINQTSARKDTDLASDISRRCQDVASQFIACEHYELAVELYKLALYVAPEDLWPKVHLAELYEQLGEFEDALNAYYEVLLQAPESPVTAEKMDALQERMAVSAADTADRWRSIVEKNPHAAIPLFHLGMALEKTQNLSEALDAYNQALAINPGLNEAEARRDRINLKE